MGSLHRTKSSCQRWSDIITYCLLQPAWNSISCMVSKLCKINMATALKVHFGTCPFVQTRPFRNIILSWQIVEMGPYYSCVSVMLGKS